MQKLPRPSAAFWSFAVSGALVATSASFAPVSHVDPQVEALRAITELAPGEGTAVLAELAPVSKSANTDNIAETTVGGVMVEIGTEANTGVTMRTIATGAEVTVGLPFANEAEPAELLSTGSAASSIAAYDNQNGSSTIPLVKDDGSVQITTVIESSGAPRSFSYPLELPAGASVALLGSGEVIVSAHDGSFIAGAHAAWAFDAKGEPVPTYYTVDGNTLTQVVEHDDQFAYPVVADPWWGQNLLEWAGVSYYSGYYAVDAKATSWGRTWNGTATHASHVTELKYKLGGNAWRVDTNSGTIREQFLCHVAGNYFEQGIYNMESNRPSVYWPLQLNLSAQCNPR